MKTGWRDDVPVPMFDRDAMSFAHFAHWFVGASRPDDSRGGSIGRTRRAVVGDPLESAPPRHVDQRIGLPDAEIAERIRHGDATLFGRLFDSYWTSLTRFAALYTHSYDEAQDVAAQVFAALWEGRSRWHPSTGISAYLYAAVRHRTKNVHRAAQRFERNVGQFLNAGESPTAGTPMLRADESVMADERRAIILDAVNTLPTRSREVLLLRWLRGMEFSEIGVVLNLSSNAVHVTYHRAIAKLREQLPKYFE